MYTRISRRVVCVTLSYIQAVRYREDEQSTSTGFKRVDTPSIRAAFRGDFN